MKAILYIGEKREIIATMAFPAAALFAILYSAAQMVRAVSTRHIPNVEVR